MSKRITIFCGHYGSGKTNLALNYALSLKNAGNRVTVADLDIVNPYFRTNDSRAELENAGIGLICSQYANTNLDIPALPQEIYAIVDDKESLMVLDIGGDDRGAYALGRLSPSIVSENSYEMLIVINFCRPLTRDARSALGVIREIEAAAGIRASGIVNNTNLGCETDEQTVLSSMQKAEELSRLSGLPIVMTSVQERLVPLLEGRVPDLFALRLQKKII